MTPFELVKAHQSLQADSVRSLAVFCLGTHSVYFSNCSRHVKVGDLVFKMTQYSDSQHNWKIWGKWT